MRSDKPTNPSGQMSTRQKITAIVFVVIIIFLGWQVYGMFSGGGGGTGLSPTPGTPSLQPAISAPQQSALPKKTDQMTPEQINALKLQQETEGRYLAALNELEMLRLAKQIAETNQAIAAAKLARVTSEKNILNLLRPEAVAPTSYVSGLESPGSAPAAPTQAQHVSDDVSYSVISVTNLRNRWMAVLGNQGNLYQVAIGDVLPLDQSTVVSIDRTGVILEKNGVRKKLSMVPII